MGKLGIQQSGFFSQKVDNVRWKAFGRHLKCLPSRRTVSDPCGFVLNLTYIEFTTSKLPNNNSQVLLGLRFRMFAFPPVQVTLP